MAATDEHDILELTADIVSAFASNNPMRGTDLPEVIASVYSSLLSLSEAKQETPPVPALTPAVPIKKSVTDDFLVCLEDGKKFKSLKRHLATAYGMTPDDYRSKWGLPRDYPMVAPSYAAKRSEFAKSIGLGSNRKSMEGDVEAPEPANDAAPAPKRAAAKRDKAPGVAEATPEPAKKRGRPKKVA